MEKVGERGKTEYLGRGRKWGFGESSCLCENLEKVMSYRGNVAHVA